MAITINLQGSPPFQTPGQWAIQRIDLKVRKEGPSAG